MRQDARRNPADRLTAIADTRPRLARQRETAMYAGQTGENLEKRGIPYVRGVHGTEPARVITFPVITRCWQ